MKPQGAFLLFVKAHAGLLGRVPAAVSQVEKLTPRFLTLYRDESGGSVGGISAHRLINTGRVDKKVIQLHTGSWEFRIPLTAAGVKAHLRRLRPHEAARLAGIDAESDALRQRLRDLEHERKWLLREAFTSGHVVTVAELREAAEVKATLQETVPDAKPPTAEAAT